MSSHRNPCTGTWSRGLFRAASIAGAGALVSLGLGAGVAAAVPAPTSPCAAVHVLAARGSTEAPGPGAIGALVAQIQSAVSSTVSTSSVSYPALLTPYDYSSTAGDTAVKQQLTAQVQACPDQKIVMVGYSQGAQIIGDALGGGGGVLGLGPASSPVPSSVAGHVAAVVQYGDPRHMPNLSFDRGTAVGATGLFPRLPSQSLVPFANIIRSFCDLGDPFCAGGTNIGAHLDYTLLYDQTATAFVVSQLRGLGVS
ncbi:cutinase family protein [Amycolatopsis australiensis]|uniref:Cutinase n=1 Tax=Amycolatopsis australiensis TaxID=546364 RepID=A0A1K1SQN9_9PSEU|nr:cutinase family protein [Amycolatopsis australiensis]SFW86399.1 Cutinase [Amycolatopsis australiensis]